MAISEKAASLINVISSGDALINALRGEPAA